MEILVRDIVFPLLRKLTNSPILLLGPAFQSLESDNPFESHFSMLLGNKPVEEFQSLESDNPFERTSLSTTEGYWEEFIVSITRK